MPTLLYIKSDYSSSHVLMSAQWSHNKTGHRHSHRGLGMWVNERKPIRVR